MLRCNLSYLIFLALSMIFKRHSLAPIIYEIELNILFNINFSTEFFTIIASSRVAACLCFPDNFIVIIGVAIFFVQLMISFTRGTPWVIFILDIPAKWNVFNVIWVAGYPILWAVRAPMAYPGSIKALFSFFTSKLKK